MAKNDGKKKKGGGLFGAVAGLIFEQPNAGEGTTEDQATETASAAEPSAATSAEFASQSAQEYDPKIYQAIMEHIERTGTALESFETVFRELAQAIPDEKQRFAAALASVKATLQFTPEKILAAVGQQLSALETEFNGYESDVQTKLGEITEREKVLGSKPKEIDSLNRQIETIKAEAARQIGEAQGKIEAINASYATDKQQIEQDRAKFTKFDARLKITVAKIRSELEASKAKILQYSKGGA